MKFRSWRRAKAASATSWAGVIGSAESSGRRRIRNIAATAISASAAAPTISHAGEAPVSVAAGASCTGSNSKGGAMSRGTVTSELLARLPDHGVVINTARGEVVDQDALFAELRSGRLRAGLDVLVDDDYLMAGHEAHTWPNAIITCHDIGNHRWPRRPPRFSESQEIALENLKRFIAGEELQFVMDEKRYLLSS